MKTLYGCGQILVWYAANNVKIKYQQYKLPDYLLLSDSRRVTLLRAARFR